VLSSVEDGGAVVVVSWPRVVLGSTGVVKETTVVFGASVVEAMLPGAVVDGSVEMDSGAVVLGDKEVVLSAAVVVGASDVVDGPEVVVVSRTVVEVDDVVSGIVVVGVVRHAPM
jgi:hypothetical protein